MLSAVAPMTLLETLPPWTTHLTSSLRQQHNNFWHSRHFCRRRYYRLHRYHHHYCHHDHGHRRSHGLPHHRGRRLLAHGPPVLRFCMVIGATLSTRIQRSATRPSSSSQSQVCIVGVHTTMRAARANFGTKRRSWDATRRPAHRRHRHRRHHEPHCRRLLYRLILRHLFRRRPKCLSLPLHLHL
jgi:hypothetical protein